ncbi:MAG: glycosyltransferase family 4 protein [Bacteroidales bacterium]|nr:glycosyltransferase family 4 protein [Bacteroidales bacterium]
MRLMKKLIRVTTVDLSLYTLLKGQLRFLSDKFDVVALAADTGVLKAVGEREGVRVIDVPMHREISLLSDFRSLFRLMKVFRKEKPDIVHANTPKGSLLSMIAAKLSGVPTRIYLVTGLRYQGFSGWRAMLLKTMERITCAFATKVIPEGKGVKDTLIRDRITKKDLEIIHNGNINGIDPAFFSREACTETREEVRARLGLPDNVFTFIFIGRMVKDKGMNELADAIRDISLIHPELKVILVGAFESELDPLAPGNEDFFKSSPNVIYVGRQSDVRPYLMAADSLVFPSYREGFPNVVLQAGAMDLPMIVTDINGCNEVVEDGVNGVIIPPRNKEALKQAMLAFLDNPMMAEQMSKQSREMVVSRYNQEDFWNSLLAMYNSL